MKGMLSGGMLLARSFERIGGASVLMLFEVLMVMGYGRRSERNGRLSPHMRALLGDPFCLGGEGRLAIYCRIDFFFFSFLFFLMI